MNPQFWSFAHLSDHRHSLFCNANQRIHDGLKFFFHDLLLLERTFGWALYSSPYLFLFALHLDWSLITSVDKNIKCSLHICEHMFHFSLRFKLSISFNFILFPLEMHRWKRKKQTRKNLNVDRQFFKDVTSRWGGGWGAVPTFRENCHPFPTLPFINTPLSNEDFYVSYLPTPPFNKSHLLLEK